MNTSQNTPQLPDPQTAYNTIFSKVAAQVFFAKLAQYGIQPQNEKEAADLLELSDNLEAIEQQAAVKIAGAVDNPYAQARNDLLAVAADAGLDHNIKQAGAVQADATMYDFAARFAQDADIYNSVLSLKAAEFAAAEAATEPQPKAATA